MSGQRCVVPEKTRLVAARVVSNGNSIIGAGRPMASASKHAGEVGCRNTTALTRVERVENWVERFVAQIDAACVGHQHDAVGAELVERMLDFGDRGHDIVERQCRE